MVNVIENQMNRKVKHKNMSFIDRCNWEEKTVQKGRKYSSEWPRAQIWLTYKTSNSKAMEEILISKDFGNPVFEFL